MIFPAPPVARGRAGLASSAAALLLAAGCTSPLPHVTPGVDPPGRYVALTTPVIALGDTQEHESTGFPLHDNDGAVDAYVEVAQRPPESPLFSRRILEHAITRHPTEPLIHLGDLLDMSCESEAVRMRRVFESLAQPGVILPGNHDGLQFGIFNLDISDLGRGTAASQWDRGCQRATGLDATPGRGSAAGAALTKREFIMSYLGGLAFARHLPWESLALPTGTGKASLSWRNPDPAAFLEAIEVRFAERFQYSRAFIAQKLRLPRAPGAPRGVTMIALDTNQVLELVGTFDTVRRLSPGDIGHVQDDQVEAIAPWIEESRRRGDIVVFAGHHNWAQLSLASHVRLASLLDTLDHPLVYLSAHTHRGFWAEHRLAGRLLLELNVSSLSDWPIAYRRVSFHLDEAANRIKVVGELMPNRGSPPGDDAELALAWQEAACHPSGVPMASLAMEDLSLVKRQKQSRGTLLEWIYEGLGENCESCVATMYEHAHRYQDQMLEAIRQAHEDLGPDALGFANLRLPGFCAGLSLPTCIASIRAQADDGFEASVTAFRRKAHLVDAVNAHLDDVKLPRAKAYMACRAVLAVKFDFDETPEENTPGKSERERRAKHFFRTEATVGLR